MSKKKNRLTLVGGMGQFRAYLNVPKEEAIERYCQTFNISGDGLRADVNEFHFDDEFETYAAWEVSDD